MIEHVPGSVSDNNSNGAGGACIVPKFGANDIIYRVFIFISRMMKPVKYYPILISFASELGKRK